MTDNNRRFEHELPERLLDAVRALYAPVRAPAGADAYWSTLETRVMARIADVSVTSWWQVLDRWANVGLVAAAAALVVVGALFARASQTELRMAYDVVTVPTPAESFTVPAEVLSQREGPDVRGTTFGDVISQ